MHLGPTFFGEAPSQALSPLSNAVITGYCPQSGRPVDPRRLGLHPLDVHTCQTFDAAWAASGHAKKAAPRPKRPDRARGRERPSPSQYARDRRCPGAALILHILGRLRPGSHVSLAALLARLPGAQGYPEAWHPARLHRQERQDLRDWICRLALAKGLRLARAGRSLVFLCPPRPAKPSTLNLEPSSLLPPSSFKNGSQLTYIAHKGNIKDKHRRRDLRDKSPLGMAAPRAIRRKAWSLARALLAGRARYPLRAARDTQWRRRWADLVEDTAGPLGQHWDNCAVSPSLPHAYGYCLKALRSGHDECDIAAAYEAALRDCHARATDLSASTGQRRQWAPSSTVSLARSLLQGRAPASWLEPLPSPLL